MSSMNKLMQVSQNILLSAALENLALKNEYPAIFDSSKLITLTLTPANNVNNDIICKLFFDYSENSSISFSCFIMINTHMKFIINEFTRMVKL